MHSQCFHQFQAVPVFPRCRVCHYNQKPVHPKGDRHDFNITVVNMPVTPGLLPWEEPGWLAGIQSWITAQLDRLGLRQTQPAEQFHTRPWSTVLRVEAAGRTLYCKAACPALRYEPALTRFLSSLHPDLLPEVLAADDARGWMLLADSGEMLRTHLHSPADLHHWRTLLPLYAALQQQTIPLTSELLAFGALDRRLENLPGKLAGLLEDAPALLIDQPESLTSADVKGLQSLLPAFETRCHDLAALPIPQTLHHDDFHDGNVFLADGRYTIADWAESGVTHPFFSLLVNQRSTAYRLDLPKDSPHIQALRQAYLDCWSAYASPAQIAEAYRLSQPLAMAARALTWYDVIYSLPLTHQAAYAEAVPGWLLEFLSACQDW